MTTFAKIDNGNEWSQTMREYTEIETITQLLGLVTEPGHIDHHVFQNIDFSDLADLASQSTYSDCLFF